MKASLLLPLVAAVAASNPFIHTGRLIPPVVPEDEYLPAMSAAEVVNKTGSGYFDQLLDHDDPSKGTFKMKFWWNSEFWAGPGSPVGFNIAGWKMSTDERQVVLFTPGETAAAPYGGYLTNATVTGLYAQELKGAVVMVERSSSSPYCFFAD